MTTTRRDVWIFMSKVLSCSLKWLNIWVVFPLSGLTLYNKHCVLCGPKEPVMTRKALMSLLLLCNKNAIHRSLYTLVLPWIMWKNITWFTTEFTSRSTIDKNILVTIPRYIEYAWQRNYATPNRDTDLRTFA